MDPLTAFSSSNVEYLIVGGWAVSVHTEPRFTKDLDVLIGRDPANLAKVADALSQFGAPPDVVKSASELADGQDASTSTGMA